ncbi:hypothetical protein ABIB86_000459 [Bradyrhizobium sp. JR1.7]|uniref:hypothetical protein n=1 Tax=unclassified Bradyrhizobium TaxID=2631580 RepID=UPI0033987A1B
MIDATFSTAGNGDRIRDRFAVFVNSSVYGRGREVLLAMVDFRGDIVAVAPSITMEAKTPEEVNTTFLPPTISGPAGTEFLQSALDAAWAAGLRPKNWRIETTEQVAAMNNHLQDMRALVFAKPVDLVDPRSMGKIT